MKRNSFALVALWAVLFYPLCAQKNAPALPQKCIATPDFIDYHTFDNSWQHRYNSYQEYVVATIKSDNYQTLTKNQKAWVVFSDRENNTTYSDPNGSSACGHLDFMDKVYIAQIKNGWALVFSDINTIGSDLSVNKSAISKGWISIDKLLLWTKCPQTAKKILQKGLIIQDLLASKNKDNESGQIKYLFAPKAGAHGSGDARQLDIPFIMKTEQQNGQTYYLLASNSLIEERGNIQKSIVLGWLSDKHLTPWNQRLCLEPAVQNIRCLKEKNIYPAIFGQSSDATAFMSSPSQQAQDRAIKPFKEPVISGQRQKGNVLRMPILEEAARNIYLAVGIGTNEETAINVANLKEKLATLQYQLNNVNIVFVLDATNSMKPYFDAVSKALTNIIRRNFAQKIKIGVVVYRNEADAEEIEYRKVTENINEIANFIDETQCYSKGKGYHESFFKGLMTALDNKKMGYDNHQSNFIIAIGDCGNKDNNEQLEKIGRQLNQNNINFFAYNVAKESNEAFLQYKMQVIKMLRTSIDQANACIGLVDDELYRIFTKSNNTCTRNLSTLHFGGMRLASNGSLNIAALNSSIVETVEKFMDYTSGQISNLRDLTTGKAKAEGSWAWESMAIFLKRSGFSDKEIQEAKEYGAPTKFPGYAPMKVTSCQENLFNYILFLSHDELAELVRVLKRINPTKSQSTIEDNLTNRKNYQDALIQLGLSFLGEKEDNIRNMDFEELLQKIYGIPVKINNCGIPSIKDLTNPNIVSGVDFRNFAHNFYNQTQKLENYISAGYRESFTNNGTLYYWIPFKDFPGYCAE